MNARGSNILRQLAKYVNVTLLRVSLSERQGSTLKRR